MLLRSSRLKVLYVCERTDPPAHRSVKITLLLVADEEGLRVDVDGLLRNLLLDDLEPFFAGEVHVLCGEAEDDVVEDAGIPELQGFLHGVDPVDFVGLLQVLDDVFGVPGSAHDDADGVDAPVVDDEDAVLLDRKSVV